VVGNLFLGKEEVEDNVTGVLLTLDEIEMEQRSVDLLKSLAVRTLRSVRIEVGSLSGGQRQTVAIARSMLGEPKVVILDEPTAALGVAQTRQVLDLILRLKERGLGVVIISHNILDVFEVADRIIVLRLGRRVATFKRSEATQDEVVAAITGADQNR
jgi:D-xylose transport system ATP-binding protein